MFSLRLILAAGSLSTLISGAPVPSSPSGLVTDVTSTPFIKERSSSAAYVSFGGTGSVTDGWPALTSWVSDFDTMFANNKETLQNACTQFDVPNNSDAEIADMSTSIKSVSSSTGVDARFILAIVLQESNGCVRAPTTNFGVVNPGLMQSHDGAGSCNGGSVSTPCPSSQITQMIQDGTAGTSSGDGLKQALAKAGTSDVSMYYIAARIYNSGSVDSSKNLGAGIATHCYSSDVANRLAGWSSGPSGCSPAAIVNNLGTPTVASAAPIIPSAVIPATTAAVPIPTTTPAADPTQASAPGGVFITGAPQPTQSPAHAVSKPHSAAPVATPSPTVAPIPATTLVPATSTAPAAPASTVTPGSGSAIAAGTACTTEGLWNCIDGTSFQQCASGTWSVVEQLAAGTKCVAGQAAAIEITAA